MHGYSNQKDIRKLIRMLYKDFHTEYFNQNNFDTSVKDIAKSCHSNFLCLFTMIVFTSRCLKSITNNSKLSKQTRKKAKEYREVFQILASNMSKMAKSIDALFVKFL